MSLTRKNIYAAAPSTTRGKNVLLGGDPKGKNFLYTCGNVVFIRDLQNPLNVDLYSEHQAQTTVARYSPSGFYIASGDVTGKVRIWDTTQKEHILKIELPILAGPILDLQWSDDSKRIIAVGDGKERYGAVFLWDTGSSVGEITGHSKAINSCDFKQTRPYRVATGSEDFLACWFEGPPFKFKKSMKEHTRFVNCVRFSPNGEKLITVSSDKTGFIYEGKNGDQIAKLNPSSGHTAGIYAAAWSPDSKRILTASADKTSKIWDENGELQQTINYSENPQVEDQQVGCLWQGDELLTVALSGDISYLDAGAGKPKRIIKGHNKFVTAVAYDASTSSIYSGSYDALLLKWDEKTGQTEGFTGKGHTNQITKMLIQGGNLVTAAMDDTVRITPLSSRVYGSDAITLDSIPVDIAVGLKDKKLILAAINGFVIVIKDGKVVTKHAVKYQPTAIALSVDETKVAVGGKDNMVYLYGLSGDKLTDGAVLKGHRGALTVVTFSPDGKYLSSADVNRDIFVWELPSNQLKISGWVFHTARVQALAWAPDSLHLVSGSLDSAIYVWDVQNPEKRLTIKDAHRGGVNAVLWIDNNTIATAGQDCCVKTWTATF